MLMRSSSVAGCKKFAWSAKLRIADVGRLGRLDRAELERLRQSDERDQTIAELAGQHSEHREHWAVRSSTGSYRTHTA